MKPLHEQQQQNFNQRRREVTREMANSQAENAARLAQCDPNETALQAQENLIEARQQGRHVPKSRGAMKNARPRVEIPGG